MKRFSIRTLMSVALLVGATTCFSQGFIAPKEGNAVVYFTRITSMGFAIPFDFFDSTAFIGQFAGRNYLRYECSPGQHLFWASSENKEFITADLEANGTYVVIVDVKMGIGMGRVGLTPISSQDKLYMKARQLVMKKASSRQDPEYIRKENARLADFIHEKLEKYDKDWKNTLTIRHLSGEMKIPADLTI